MAIYKAKNGNKYSEDTVMSAADKAGISLDEFVSNKGLEKIEEEEDTNIDSAKINDIEINDTQEDDAETIDVAETTIEPPKKKKKPTSIKPKDLFGKVKTFDPLGLNKLKTATTSAKPKKSVFDFSAANSAIDNSNSKLIESFGGPKAPELRSPMVAKMDAEALKKQRGEKQAIEKQQAYLDETKEYRQAVALEKLSFENPNNVNYDIDKESATISAINLNKKINRLGLEAEEFGDEVIFRKIGEEEGFGGTKNGTHFALSDIKGMNQFVSNFGDKTYAKKVKEISATKYPDLFQKITPPVLSEEEKRKQANLELVGTFQNLSKAYGFDEALGGRAAAITKESFDNPEDYNFYKQWAKNQNSVLNLPQSRIDAWDKTRKEKFINKASTDYARSLDPSDRKNLQIVVQEKINESRYASEKLTQDIGDYKIKVNNFNKDAEEYKKAPTAEKLDILKARQLGLIDELNDITDREKDLQKETDYTKGILAPALTSFSANYNRINQLTNAATSTLSNVAVGLRDISAYGSAVLIDKTQEEIVKDDSLGIFHTARELELQKQQYQKTVGIDEIKSFDDAGNWLMSSTINTLPSIGMAFTGAAALPLFFASGYGGKATQIMQEAEDAKKRLSENTYAINNTDDAFIKAQLQQQINADEDLLNLPEYKKLLGKLVYGGAEVGFEMLGTLKILKGLGTAARMLPKKSLKDGLLWAGKNATKNFNREGLSELGTTVTDNFVDMVVLGENKNLFEGGLESYVQGGIAGAGFGGIDTYKVVKRAIVSELAAKKQSRRVQDIVNQISDLTGIEGYRKDQSIPLPMQTPAIQKLVAELVDESNGIENEIINRLGVDLTLEQATQIGDLNRQIREVNKDFSEAAKDPNLKPAQLKTLEGYYRNKFNELANQRETLLTDPAIIAGNKQAIADSRFEFDLTQGYNMYNKRLQQVSLGQVVGNFSNLNAITKNELLFNAKNELELEAGASTEAVTQKQIENRALENYAEEHYTKAIKEGIVNAQAFADDKGINVEIQSFEGPNADENIINAYNKSKATSAKKKEFAKNIKNGSAEGTNININGRDIALVHIKNSAKNGRTGVGSHEVLHSAVKKAFVDQKGIDKAGSSLLEYLEKYNPDLSALVTERIDSSYSKRDKNNLRLRDENGEIIKDEDYYEEALNALSDISADGVELPADSLNAIRNFINGILPKGFPKFKENQGADIYEFVKNYNKEAHFGKNQPSNLISFSGKIIGGDQEERPTMKQSITKVNEVQQKIDKLEDQYDNDEIEYEAYENKLSILKDELKKAKAIPEEVAKPKVEKPKVKISQEDEVAEIIKNEKGTISSDKVQQIYESKGVNGANEIIKLFKPITNKIVDKRRDAPGFDRELLTDEIETGSGGILDLIRSYNASKGVPLGAYINKQLPLRAIASSKRLLDESFSKDVTEEKSLIATETSTETKEKPKYKNALESKVFSPEVLKTATNKIITIVRTLKSRIDAPVTLNRTVTPLISEIRDEVGKQLDIDIKTMLGGKKDGVLKKELVRTKRYILENMTTTWLMGKDGQGGIPQAIQKQINGKYVSYPEWVGQKIDREKTTTDQAGRTSGAELVRRLPNVANNISDEVFLSQIIGTDGNPIRGRKESLSKAMSEEGAFDIINNDFEIGGPIFDAFKVNQERLGVEIAANAVVTFAAQSERGNIKQSVTYNNFTQEQKNIFNSKVSELSSGLNPYLNNIDNPDTVGRVFRNTFKDYFSKDEINGLLKDFAPWLRQIKDVSNSDTLYLEDKNLDLDTFIKNVSSMYEFGVLGVLKMPYTHEDLFSKDNVISARTATINMFSNWVDAFGKEKAIEMMIYSGGTFKSNSALGNKKGIALVNGEIIETGKEGRKSNQITQNSEDYWNNIVYASLPDGASEENQKLLKRIQKETASKRKKDSASKAFADRDFEGREAQSKKYQEIVQETFKYYFNDKNGVSDIDKAIMIVQMGSNMETAIRKAAVFTHIFVNPTGAKVGALRYEHTRPASQVAAELLAAYKKYKGNVPQEVLDSIWETYTAAVIPVAMDDQINAAGFKSIMPPGWVKGMPTSYRYYNYATFGKDNIFAIESLNPKDKGAIIGQEFATISKIFIKPKINAIKIDAIQKSSKNSITPKGISVFDFDDTSAFTSGSVLYTMPDGSKGKLNAEEFAKEGSSFLEEGAVFDFSEFSKVVDGKPGPMVEKIKKMIAKFGNENFFILTARPANAAVPIKEFLDSIGIDIPLENITGLGNSAAQAKADWMTAKAAEGYNDFYFADDAIQNVKAVKDALDVLDVKSKIQQAKIKFSKTISPEFNKIIEENTGMENYKVFSDIVARRRGINKNKFDFYVPPSAADFELLLYNFIGKGTRGEEQQKFFADALLKPYANGNDLMDAARQSIKNDYKALINQFPGIKKKIESLTPDGDFTYDQAIRVALWTEEGIEIPGLSQRDQTKLVDLVNNDPELTAFKQGVLVTGRQGKGWIAPTEYWDASTIISDLHNLTEGAGRKKFLAEFIENTEEMFGKFENGKLVGPNINKIEAVYGTNVREALDDQLYRMINGKNRSYGSDKETSMWSNWVNGSTGAIMFLNTRSAVLQLLGAVNFLNLRDNNPIAAGKAFANQKQYWADFSRIWNSDKIKERRGGLKEDVAAAEIANAAAGSKNKVNAVISYLLKIGYTPTQLADSFAIASGGAPYYRNRINTYLKEGQSQEDAEKNAWSDFTKVSDDTQQSGDPRDISKQQASPAGRLLLTFQNFSMQQSRIVKKSFLDLKNGRGDAKTHVAKIIYYLAVQNILFATLQQGLFAVAFDDDDEELDKEKDKAKKKTLNERLIGVADGVLDTILRGTGFVGGVVSVLKNMTKKYLDEKDKGFKADYAKVMLEGANISPPIGSKLRKVYTGLQQTKFEKDLIAERGWGVTQDGRVHLGPMYGVTGKLVEATTNIPMDRLVNKIENVSQAMNSQNKAWQRVAVGLGFTPYSVGIEDTKGDLEIRAKAKVTRKEAGKVKIKEASKKERDSIANLSPDAYMDFVRKRKEDRERKKDSIANLPADQKKAYLEKKEIESNARKREKEALNKIKADSIAGLSPTEKANYNKKVAAEKLQKKKERHDKYEEKKKALQDSLAGLTPRQREKYKADKKAERHQYYIKNKKPSKKKNRTVSSDVFI